MKPTKSVTVWGKKLTYLSYCMLTFPRKIIVSSREWLGFWKAGKNSKAWFCKLDKRNDAACSHSNRRLGLIQKRDGY